MSATESFNVNDCPICMDTIVGLCNRVVTECGHAFHCSCLMQNAVHNGFGCPYCRTTMADILEDDEDDEDNISVISSVFDDDVLATFRMFHQQINGEEVEEVVESEEEEDDEDEEDEGYDVNRQPCPQADYVTRKLMERGVTFEDLVKNILYQEHDDWGRLYNQYEQSSSEIYGKFRAVISSFRAVISSFRPEELANIIAQPLSRTYLLHRPLAQPVIAEAKSSSVVRRREFISHV